MEKVIWDTMIVPGLREQLIRKYVPGTSHLRCEGTDPLVYKVTAFYWLLQELVGNWKTGRRLTIDEKAKLLELLVWNLSQIESDEYESQIVCPGIESFTEHKVRRQSFDHPREAIPHAVDVALCETSDDDTTVSRETTEQIAQLMLACKEFHVKVADDFSERV